MFLKFSRSASKKMTKCAFTDAANNIIEIKSQQRENEYFRHSIAEFENQQQHSSKEEIMYYGKEQPIGQIHSGCCATDFPGDTPRIRAGGKISLETFFD